MKNRRILWAVTALLLLTCFLTSAFAAGNYFYVTDEYGLLSAEENDRLEQKAAQVSRQHQFGVYVAVLDQYQNQGYHYLRDYGEALYKSRSFGFGDEKAGMLFIISMTERDYSLVFPTSEYNVIFTESGLDRIEESVSGYLRDGDYYGAFNRFINYCDEYMTAYENGEPIDEKDYSGLLIAVVCGVVAAVVTGLILFAPMHSSGQKTEANQYIVDGSLRINRRSDMFLHRSVVRTPRQTSSSSGSHSSTHHSSGGFSSRSGKF